MFKKSDNISIFYNYCFACECNKYINLLKIRTFCAIFILLENTKNGRGTRIWKTIL